MALIDRIAPGSIRSIDDMAAALYLVLEDSFADVGSCDGRSRNCLNFVLNESGPDLGFKVAVLDYFEETYGALSDDERKLVKLAREGGVGRSIALLEHSIDDGPDRTDPRPVIEAMRRLGLTPAQAISKMAAQHVDGYEEDTTMDQAWRDVESYIKGDDDDDDDRGDDRGGPEGEGDADDGPATAGEHDLIRAARRLGLSPAAAVMRLLDGEPSQQCDLDAEKATTMEQARARLEDFIRLEARIAAGDDQGEHDDDGGPATLPALPDDERALIEAFRRLDLNAPEAIRRMTVPPADLQREPTMAEAMEKVKRGAY